jgi:transketolase
MGKSKMNASGRSLSQIWTGAYTELRDAIFGTKTFGASAPLKDLLVKFQFSGDNVYVAAKHQLAHKE